MRVPRSAIRPVLMLLVIPVLLQVGWVLVSIVAPTSVREAALVFRGYWSQLLCSIPGCIFLIRRLRWRAGLALLLYIPVAVVILFLVSLATGFMLTGE